MIIISTNLKNKVQKYIKFSFIFLVIILIVFEFRHFIHDFNSQSLSMYFSDIPIYKTFLIICLGIIAFLPMCLYDFTIKNTFNSSIKLVYIFKCAWISSSISNIIGFGGSSSIAIKSDLYKNYTNDSKLLIKDLSKILFLNLTGLSILCLFYTITNLTTIFTISLNTIVVMLLSLYTPILIAYLFIKYKKTKKNIGSISQILEIILISFFEWIFVALLLFSICFFVGVKISFYQIFPIFIFSVSIGIISMIPGGLGSFDLSFLLSLQALGVAKEQVLLVLILYRLSYYIVPLIIGIILYLGGNWNSLNNRYNNIPTQLLSTSAHMLLVILVFSSGVILLISAALPSIITRVKLINDLASFYLINLSHTLSIIVGFLLISLSRMLYYKSKDIYKVTLILLVLGALFTFSKGLDYEEASFLFLVGFILYASRSKFYREKFIMTWGRIISDIAILFSFLVMYIIIAYINKPSHHIHLSGNLQNLLSPHYTNLVSRSILGFCIAILFLIILYCFNKFNRFKHAKFEDNVDEIETFINEYTGTPLTHLIYLKDKYVYFNKEKTIMLQYKPYADKLIVLGDIIGDSNSFNKSIEEFYDFCDIYGYTPVFYQISSSMLPFLHEMGNDFMKLGEEAKVDINSFSITGKKMKGIRTSINKVEKEGYSYEVVTPPFSNEFIDNLKSISDNWLGNRIEKGFSLGFFDEYYLSKSSIFIVKDSNNNLKGFANIMPMYDNNESFSIDLMRFSNDSCRGIMDYLFVKLIEYGKKEGYQYFNIGMAPLSNVGLSKYAFLGEKIASQIYLYGQHFYSFQGLRTFKEKYSDIWEPKYISYRKKSSLLFTMIQVSLLISKKIQK